MVDALVKFQYDTTEVTLQSGRLSLSMLSEEIACLLLVNCSPGVENGWKLFEKFSSRSCNPSLKTVFYSFTVNTKCWYKNVDEGCRKPCGNFGF